MAAFESSTLKPASVIMIADFLVSSLASKAYLAPFTRDSKALFVNGLILALLSPSVANLLVAFFALNLIELVPYVDIALLRFVFFPIIDE